MKSNKTWGLCLAIIAAAFLSGCADEVPEEGDTPAAETAPAEADAPTDTAEEAPAAKDGE